MITHMTMTAEVSTLSEQITELIKQVQSGHEVLLTQDNQPIAKLVPATGMGSAVSQSLHFRSLKGHRVLTPAISQTELAEEMFERK